MANPIVNHALIDTLGGTIADEAVPENVPAAKVFPFAAEEHLSEMVTGFVRRDAAFFGTVFAIPINTVVFGKREDALRFLIEPLLYYLPKHWRQR